MSMHNFRVTAGLVLSVTVLLAACGESTSTTTAHPGGDHELEYAFGGPADASQAARTLEIVATDDFRFAPSEVTVNAGETVTFRIVNAGQLIHDFTLGDQSTQDEHAEEMADMDGMMMHDGPNTVAVAAGETKELTWRFGQPGTVLMGCHQPGHYPAGMKGEITVES